MTYEEALATIAADRAARTEAQKEKKQASNRRWAQANPEKHREYARCWAQANSDKKRERDRRWRAANPDKKREHNRRWRETNPGKRREIDLQRKFNITHKQYEQILTDQEGGCAICGTQTPGGRGKYFHVDHCHTTGVVRGLLCQSCNTSLGGFKDNYGILRKAAYYLERFNAEQQSPPLQSLPENQPQ